MRPSPRFHAAIAALPLAVWTVFHLWEQWSVFAGRDAWVARASETSRGVLAIATELALVIVPIVVWGALTVRSLVRREPLPGGARDDDVGLVRAIGRLAPYAAVVSLLFLAVHVGHLWALKLRPGRGPIDTWVELTHAMGRPEMLVVYAIGLGAIALHFAASLPAALEALGIVTTPSGRRSAMLLSITFALCTWMLAAQLVGWLGTGTGTFWPIDVVR